MSSPADGHGFWVTNRLANPILRPLLRGPLGRRLGRRLAVLRYEGRRTGHRRELVVQYAREADRVWIVPGQPDRKRWWRNMLEPRAVELWLAGHRLPGVARVIRADGDAEEAAKALAAYAAVFPRTRNASVVVRVDLEPPSGRRAGWPAVLGIVAVLAVACGGDGSGDGYEVRSSTVKDETTQEMLVFEPDGEGPWPVVFALHGIDGAADQMAELGRRLAAEGLVVFAPNYRTDFATDQGQLELARDIECAYRYARSVADDHGGDLEQPLTFLGWSLGASFAIQGGLQEEIDPSGQLLSCFEEVPRADVVVAISGCHDEAPPNMFDASEWTNDVAPVLVMAGDADTTCPASQSQHVATRLRSAGYEVDLVLLEGASHFAPVFHDFVDGEMVPDLDSPIGDQVVAAIVDAIDAAGDGG